MPPMPKGPRGKLLALAAAFALAFPTLALSAFLSLASAGCMCRNYIGKPFCAENLLACQVQAGNCMEECNWHKAEEPKKIRRKVTRTTTRIRNQC